MLSGTYLTPTTAVVIYNNTSQQLQQRDSGILQGQWSTGNGVDGQYPYGVPPKTIDPGANGRIQLINAKGGASGGRFASPSTALPLFCVTWKGSDGSGGDLPAGTFITSKDVTVKEIQSIVRD
ncbi:hypothetical protein ACQEU8_00935 [Streptomyces sp. CA-250714]|uniref:hypothetical protein n=1 Tax=Streptomyces sp. CA-250714 TaxID=3240060 RepID=UPI003D8D80E9